MSNELYRARARIMKALANPVRLRVVDELSRGECCLCELLPLFRMDKSTLSRHLAALRQVGIVRERREGVRLYLSLATPCIANIFDCVARVIESEAMRHIKLAKREKSA